MTLTPQDAQPASTAQVQEVEAPTTTTTTTTTEVTAEVTATTATDGRPEETESPRSVAASPQTAPPAPPLAASSFPDTKVVCPSSSSPRVFTREDEHRLAALTKRETDAEEKQPLTADEKEELKDLAARYQVFLDEGERVLLRGATTATGSSPRSGATNHEETFRKVVAGTSSALVTAGKGAFFWGTLVGTAVPGYIGKQLGLTRRFDHWNWLSNKLILGALPVVTSVGTSGNHLEQLKGQCEYRKVKLGLVVAALQQEEMQGYGVGVLHFATADHWKQHFGLESYEHVPMPDATAQTTYEAVKHAVDRMHLTMHTNNEVVYVHCKAGKGRSWMIVMCYLLTYGGMDWNTAKTTVESGRHQVSPGHSQQVFAQEFARRFNLEAGSSSSASPGGVEAIVPAPVPVVSNTSSPSAATEKVAPSDGETF